MGGAPRRSRALFSLSTAGLIAAALRQAVSSAIGLGVVGFRALRPPPPPRSSRCRPAPRHRPALRPPLRCRDRWWCTWWVRSHDRASIPSASASLTRSAPRAAPRPMPTSTPSIWRPGCRRRPRWSTQGSDAATGVGAGPGGRRLDVERAGQPQHHDARATRSALRRGSRHRARHHHLASAARALPIRAGPVAGPRASVPRSWRRSTIRSRCERRGSRRARAVDGHRRAPIGTRAAAGRAGGARSRSPVARRSCSASAPRWHRVAGQRVGRPAAHAARRVVWCVVGHVDLGHGLGHLVGEALVARRAPWRRCR